MRALPHPQAPGAAYAPLADPAWVRALALGLALVRIRALLDGLAVGLFIAGVLVVALAFTLNGAP
jgi:hypothetical protein